MNTSSQVPTGPSSILGWLAAAAGLITSTVQSLEHGQALASGPGKWPAILGVLSLAATNAGRQFQAAHLTKAAAVLERVGEDLPTLAEELASLAGRPLTDPGVLFDAVRPPTSPPVAAPIAPDLSVQPGPSPSVAAGG